MGAYLRGEPGFMGFMAYYNVFSITLLTLLSIYFLGLQGFSTLYVYIFWVGNDHPLQQVTGYCWNAIFCYLYFVYSNPVGIGYSLRTGGVVYDNFLFLQIVGISLLLQLSHNFKFSRAICLRGHLQLGLSQYVGLSGSFTYCPLLNILRNLSLLGYPVGLYISSMCTFQFY